MFNIERIKNICVLGAGESGMGAALLAKQKHKNVFVSDGYFIKEEHKQKLKKYNIDFEENMHSEDKILATELIIKSPGISEKTDIMHKIRLKNIPVMSEIDFAYAYKGDSKVIAITGSNGKSTTTTLMYHILKNNNYDVAMAGNIGVSFAREIFMQKRDYYVIEVSSFQLDDIHFFKPNIAILLNITPDHLDRYNYEVEKYIHSKFNITRFQTLEDYFIYCEDDKLIFEHISQYFIKARKLSITMKRKLIEGAYMDRLMHVNFDDQKYDINLDGLPLQGKHNQYNMLAASLASSVMNIKKEDIRQALQSFAGLEHRMEFVLTIRGVDYINDSKATNINSTWYALESLKKKCILILGGIDKGNDYATITELVKNNVKAIVCLGLDNSKIINHFQGIVPVYDSNSLENTLAKCYELAAPQEAVLLSPACASFDLFENYEDRGKKFKQMVKEL